MVYDKDQDTEILIAITEDIVRIDTGGGAARTYLQLQCQQELFSC